MGFVYGCMVTQRVVDSMLDVCACAISLLDLLYAYTAVLRGLDWGWWGDCVEADFGEERRHAMQEQGAMAESVDSGA